MDANSSGDTVREGEGRAAFCNNRALLRNVKYHGIYSRSHNQDEKKKIKKSIFKQLKEVTGQ